MQNRNIKLFLSADLCSQFGAGMTIAVLSWYALDKSGSNQLVATIINANVISGILMSLFAGVIVDNFSKKFITILSYILRILFIAVPLLLLTVYGYNKYFLLLIALSNGLGWNLYYPASKGLLQEISTKEQLLKSNSGAEITMQVGLFSSGAIAGSLYNICGFKIILIMSIITFLVSAFLTSLLKTKKKKPVSRDNFKIKDSYVEGMKYFQHHGAIFFLGLILFIPFIGANVINTILPGYASIELNTNAAVYGLIDMAYGIGACVVGFTIIGLSKRFSINMIVSIGFIIGILTGLVLFTNTSKFFAGVLFFICGLCGPGIRSLIYSLIMKVVPNEFLGRTMSLWNLLSLMIQVIATFAIGKIMDIISPAWGFLIYSFILIIGLVLFFSIARSINKYIEVDTEQYNRVSSGS
ncbi:MFS transporter [Priestia megaterium]|uniref:MFS transporter n=2 Tax=Priestia megaterium TaxID=1404 RepID=UPI002E1FAABC|nr:MFS transporter [Priestia megaterium]